MFRFTCCFFVVATLPIKAQEKPPIPKPPVLSPGTIRVLGTSIRCQITTTAYRTVNEARQVVKQGQVHGNSNLLVLKV